MPQPVIVIHGGAWAVPDSLAEASRRGVKTAGRAGHKVLAAGGSALDAVTEAVKTLEDDPAFDAGRGSVLTSLGEVEMDAMLMEGRTLACGGVAAVNNVRNPIELARLVLERTSHTLIVGAGANKLAEEFSVAQAGPDYLVTEAGRREWETYQQYSHTVDSLFSQRHHDTVGAVALDMAGNVACATSTGGITGKREGRVGDSPLVGSGGYADNMTGAVSTTGHGESITKVCLARSVLHHLETGGLSPDQAATASLANMYERVGGSGGLVLVTRDGRFTAQFTTERMPWAALTGNTLQSGFLPGECLQETINQTDK